MKVWYKIVEKKNGKLLSLFHANCGTRELKVGEWIGSVRMKVRDGTNGRLYVSGWHVIATKGEAKRYLKKFTADRELLIVPCRARGTHPKSHSRYDVHLAKHIFIHEETVNES